MRRIILCLVQRRPDNRLHIAVHSFRDSFEFKKGSELKDITTLKQRIQGEIEYITEILDELFQNKYLFGGG